jgi:hypothetical protein
MHHRDVHPVDVPGCFGCKCLGIRYQGHRSRQGKDPIRRTPAIADHGPRAGKPAGYHTDHWDGRRDATVHPGAVRVRLKTEE